MTKDIRTELSYGTLTVTIARPTKKNALTDDMYDALADAIVRAEADVEVRTLLFQADGDTFTAGNDISDFVAQAERGHPKMKHATRFLRVLANASVPIIAAVQGKAVGVGATMLLHCDYVLLSKDAQLVTPFVNLGLVPEAGSSYLLPLRIGHARAFEMFALGEPLSADVAVAWGIANRVVPEAELRKEARVIADKVVAKPLESLKAMKRMMRDVERIAAQMDFEDATFQERLSSAEAKEAFAAFAQKRQPDFTKIYR